MASLVTSPLFSSALRTMPSLTLRAAGQLLVADENLIPFSRHENAFRPEPVVPRYRALYCAYVCRVRRGFTSFISTRRLGPADLERYNAKPLSSKERELIEKKTKTKNKENLPLSFVEHRMYVVPSRARTACTWL